MAEKWLECLIIIQESAKLEIENLHTMNKFVGRAAGCPICTFSHTQTINKAIYKVEINSICEPCCRCDDEPHEGRWERGKRYVVYGRT